MLRLVVSTYNDFPLIKKTVESVEVDEIVAVDGRYKDFPGETDASSDGTLEYLESVNARIIEGHGLTEVEKRNLYLVGEPGDVYIHLDGDEEWVGDISIPYEDMLIANMLVESNLRRKSSVMKRVRLFKHVEGLHYEGKHYWLKDGEGKTFSLLCSPGLNYSAFETDKVKMLHHESSRSEERNKAKKRYYRALVKIETNLKETR